MPLSSTFYVSFQNNGLQCPIMVPVKEYFISAQTVPNQSVTGFTRRFYRICRGLAAPFGTGTGHPWCPCFGPVKARSVPVAVLPLGTIHRASNGAVTLGSGTRSPGPGDRNPAAPFNEGRVGQTKKPMARGPSLPVPPAARGIGPSCPVPRRPLLPGTARPARNTRPARSAPGPGRGTGRTVRVPARVPRGRGEC